ncbi:hypothetical protein [Nonomuraea sp. CA-141351]
MSHAKSTENPAMALDAVVKEVPRVRPVVHEAPRLLDAPLEPGGYEVPA